MDVATGAVMRYERGGYHVDFERGIVALGLETLTTDTQGRVVVPPTGEAVAVVDETSGLGYVFTP